MKTKEAIEFLIKTKLWNLGDDSPIGKLKYEKQIDKVIELLKRGEKFEKMWKNLKWIFKIPIASINGKFILKGIKLLELKYLPKED